jgi:ketosteroid isomerase-like protein
MADSPVDVVSNAYESFGRGDLEALFATMAPTISWHCPEVLPQGGNYEGLDGVREFLTRLAEAWGDVSVEVDAMVGDGDRVVVLGRTSGAANAAGGTRVEYHTAHAWRVRDGQIVSFDEYLDPDPVLAAGLSGRVA